MGTIIAEIRKDYPCPVVTRLTSGNGNETKK